MRTDKRHRWGADDCRNRVEIMEWRRVAQVALVSGFLATPHASVCIDQGEKIYIGKISKSAPLAPLLLDGKWNKANNIKNIYAF